MRKITKSFSLSEDVMKIIQDYADQNKINSLSAALETIVKSFSQFEGKKDTDQENLQELKKLRKAVSGIERKQHVLYEMMNNMLILQNADSFISSDLLKNTVTEQSEEYVKSYMHRQQLQKKKH